MYFLSFFYDLGLIFLGLFAFPKLIYMRVVHKKYKQSLNKRFGREFPEIIKGKRYLIWIHAVSVGEIKAIASLAKLLKQEFGNPLLVISTGTETGQAEARRAIPYADYHVYLPLDVSWIIKRIVKKTAPDLVILSESDFWFNFLRTSKKMGAKTVLVNGKISETSLHRYLWIPFFTRALFSAIDKYCVQNQAYSLRFEQLGIPNNKISITGNMKFDDTFPHLAEEECEKWKKQLGIKPGDQILVCGSTHDPEEALVLDILQSLWKRHPNIKALLVPRHPERFNEVASLLQKQGISWQRFTHINGNNQQSQVILIDAMGLLRQCYQVADIALVGGSFTNRVGGHNIIEPSFYGVPVLFGPYMHSQPELVELVTQYGSGLQVRKENLEENLENLFQNPVKRTELGNAGKRLVSEIHGATHKALEGIKSII